MTAREASHTPRCRHPIRYKGEPSGYVAWHEWALEKSATYRSEYCPYCRLYAVWRSKRTGRIMAGSK